MPPNHLPPPWPPGQNPVHGHGTRFTAAPPLPRKTDGMAIASLVFGLLSFALPVLSSILAVIFGHIGRANVRHSAGQLKGGGLALAGLILGYIGVALWAAFIGGAALYYTGAIKPVDRSIGHEDYNAARLAFKTRLISQEREDEPTEPPPQGVFELVKYPSPAGNLDAYVSPDPKDGKPHPAIIWITGGFSNSIGDCWSESSPANNQNADAYRKAGIIMMHPSRRGGNENPGYKEAFLGEVDDVLAALQWLKQREYVDASRIYLGGHSTGGTLVLLAAAASSEWRAVFSFGPVDDVTGYGQEELPFNASDKKEREIRAPINWLHLIKSPTFVMEGTVRGNISSLRLMRRSCTNPQVTFLEGSRASHFSLLHPANKHLASLILQDTGREVRLPVDMEKILSGLGRP